MSLDMKKILCLYVWMVFSAGAFASDSYISDEERMDSFIESLKEYCESVASGAESVMKMRQVGVSSVNAMKVATNSDSIDSLMIDITIDAYSKPIYSTHEEQYRAKRDFGTKHYLQCLRSDRWKAGSK